MPAQRQLVLWRQTDKPIPAVFTSLNAIDWATIDDRRKVFAPAPSTCQPAETGAWIAAARETGMYYRLDHADRIIEVHSDWDAFSSANGGGLRSRSVSVVGRPLLDFVAGDAPRMFMRAALQAARLLGERRTLPYRCDSPSHRRHFEMAVIAGPERGVLVEHILLREELRSPGMGSAPAKGRGIRCSQCLSLQRWPQPRWLPADQVAIQAPATAVCPTCASRLNEFTCPPVGRAHDR